MKNEDLIVVAQLLAAMKDAVERIAVAERNKDAAGLTSAKKEILMFQRQIQDLL
jgi:PHD/YefM family antitoxin component YafN of YafNO toxin-antitoxin module